MVGRNYNTPIRNRKVGLTTDQQSSADPQANAGQQRPEIAITGPSAMVQQMAQRNFALNNGGQMPPMQGNGAGSPPPVVTMPPQNYFGGGNQAIGKFETPPTVGTNAQVQQQQAAPIGTNVMTGSPDGRVPAVGYVNSAVETSNSMAPDPRYGTDGVQFTNPASTGQNDYSSLSAALNGTGSQPQQAQQPQFKADPNKRDGGFFGWLKGLVPKKRPGKREGETDDEYDARRTRNMEMVATLADAIRHMGNIVNTSKSAPLQKFNDPSTMIEQGYQTRKAQRQKQAALDADAAYKLYNLSLKEAANKANNNYKQLLLAYKDAADRRAAQAAADNKKYKDDYFAWQREQADKNRERQTANDKQKQQNWEKNFNETKRHHAASESISASKGRGGGSGKHGGSGGKYWFEDKEGKMRYQPNKTMYEQEFFREYGYLPGDKSTSNTTKSVDYKTGKETTTTTRTKGSSMTAKAAEAQNKAAAARKKAAEAKKSVPSKKSKNRYKNTKALGL